MRAVGIGSYHDIFIFRALVNLALGAQQNLTGIGTNGSAGQVQGGARYGAGNLIQGQAILAQGKFGDLNSYFKRADILDIDL